MDTPFKNISEYGPELGSKMVDSAFEALDRIVDRAISEKVDFVIFSGDIFDTDHSTPRSRYLFAEAIKRAGVRCYIAYGNHDYKRKWEDSIPLPPNAVVFPEHAVNIPYPDEENKIADVIGISHSVKEEGRDLTEDIAGSSDFSIAVVHCDLDTVSEGRRYAPARLSSLMHKKIDYWALGHIHKRNIIHKFPHVVYPGNTQGRSPKETGDKGAYLVTVSNGVVEDMEFFRTGPMLWEDAEQDITGKTMDSLLSEISEKVERGSFLKLRITGRSDLDRMIRLQQQVFKDLVERKTGCRIARLDIGSGPLIDMDQRRSTGDFTSAVISSGDIFAGMERDQLISAICGTKASVSVRHIFEAMTDEELQEMVRDARTSLVERLTEERS